MTIPDDPIYYGTDLSGFAMASYPVCNEFISQIAIIVLEASGNMKKILMVCICATLIIGIPFTSLAAQPEPFMPEHRKITATPTIDPDGPFAGGLDDPTDWINLVSCIGNLFLIPGYLLALSYIINEQQGLQGLPGFIWNFLLIYWGVRYGVVNGFTDAFDLQDPDGDGR